MLVVGNWKMNGTAAVNNQLLQAILADWSPLRCVDVAICPPFVYLPQVVEMLSEGPINVGGQSLNPRVNGAFTGEVSGEMLLDCGCRYVIVGHNERRRMQAETDLYVAEQFLAAQKNGLIPILCVGESEQAREAGQAFDAIAKQLKVVIDAAGLEAFSHAVVAYEPIWAVGTGKTATPDQAQEMHTFIRGQFGALGKNLVILYGGSVKASNAVSLFAESDIDGALLGGASLNAEDFIAICQSAEQVATGVTQ
ncbi:triose-phosphate isomerase [Gilvimarinus polysaccharolyticus]|uniref:triose-phosphate isomerase n=1 Tax=Gilvimarinus polysaccharolyticus TaxID=863921 RepID=UPI0006737FEE|nr:triose-phosphate isomerase [Gilvimarinus polysaccharolyticus]